MNFDFYTAGRIVFGKGSFDKIGEILRAHARRFLVVVNGDKAARNGTLSRLEQSAQKQGVILVIYDKIMGEPELDMMEEALAFAADKSIDGVLAMGGGTAIDAGKALAALIPNGGPVIEYLEGVGNGRQVAIDPLPFIAVPVTAGTGAEVTKNSVIASQKLGFKKSMRSEKMLARVALVDPELTVLVSPRQTAWSGMDAITQLIESYVTRKSNPITEALAERGLRAATFSMLRAYEDGTDIAAREGMCLASLLSGICLANSGLGAAHGCAAALGAVLGIPHGLACAILLPHVMLLNMETSLGKYAQIGRLLTGMDAFTEQDTAIAGVETIKAMNRKMGIPAGLKYLELDEATLRKLASASMGSSMNGNPLPLDEEACYVFLKGLTLL